MRCSYESKRPRPDGSFDVSTCINEADILDIGNPCRGLCYRCAYEKLQSDKEGYGEYEGDWMNAPLGRPVKAHKRKTDKKKLVCYVCDGEVRGTINVCPACYDVFKQLQAELNQAKGK